MFYLKRMFARKWMTLLFAVIFILLFTVLPYGFYLSWEAKVYVSDTLEQIDRGSYDILVRPIKSKTATEINMHTLDDSYAMNRFRITDNKMETEVPGFTFEEWQNIANDPRIEVAAPIATIGFMKSAQQSLVYYPSETSGNYRYQIEYYTTDGIKEYVLDTQYHYLLENELGQFAEKEINSLFPETSHLLVGIDPTTEHKLTGIDFTSLLEESEGSKSSEREETEFIKVMQRNKLTTPLSLRITIDQIDLSENNKKNVEYLQELPGSNIMTYESDLTDYLQPFTGAITQLLPEGQMENVVSPDFIVNQLPNNYLIMGSNLY